MIKQDLLVTVTDPFNEPAMRLTTLEEDGSVLIEMLEVNKNKFSIQELKTALEFIENFHKSLYQPMILVPASSNVTVSNFLPGSIEYGKVD